MCILNLIGILKQSYFEERKSINIYNNCYLRQHILLTDLTLRNISSFNVSTFIQVSVINSICTGIKIYRDYIIFKLLLDFDFSHFHYDTQRLFTHCVLNLFQISVQVAAVPIAGSRI